MGNSRRTRRGISPICAPYRHGPSAFLDKTQGLRYLIRTAIAAGAYAGKLVGNGIHVLALDHFRQSYSAFAAGLVDTHAANSVAVYTKRDFARATIL